VALRLLGHDNVLVRNRFEGYSDGIQVNGGNRNYIGANVFTNNALGLSRLRARTSRLCVGGW
jgi:3-dehydroshikimate dehydratase